MKCKKLVRAIIAFAVAGSMSMTVNATSISDLKDQKPFSPSWRKNRIRFWMRLQNWMRR